LFLQNLFTILYITDGLIDVLTLESMIFHVIL